MFEGREYIGPELDCWSLGCILYVLVVGTLPFDAPDMAQLKVCFLIFATKTFNPYWPRHEPNRFLKNSF